MGSVNISSYTNELDIERLMIKWMDVPNDRSYYFFCANKEEFLSWTEVN